MSEIARILDQFRRAWDGDAWHGPPLLAVLKDVDAATANAHPIRGAHSIAEIVGHLAYWQGAARRRLAGEKVSPTEAEQWPPVPDTTKATWEALTALLGERHRVLEEALSRLGDGDLSRQIGKEPSSDVYYLLHGIIQHDLYHAGQVALLKKAARG
jgi:uncharacterized damage-inducible protein DinB